MKCDIAIVHVRRIQSYLLLCSMYCKFIVQYSFYECICSDNIFVTEVKTALLSIAVKIT